MTMRAIRDPSTGKTIYNAIAILDVWCSYYNKLFTAEDCDMVIQDEMFSNLSYSLNETEQNLCDGPLTLEECHASLSGLQDDKTPGSDGFPKEFFLN